jgi:hypothetical protein
LTETEKANVKAEIENLQSMISHKPAEGERKKMLQNKFDNITEMLKIVRETANKTRRLEKAWDNNIASIKETFELSGKQLEDFKTKIAGKKSDFFKEEIKNLSAQDSYEINEEKVAEQIKKEAQQFAA